MTAESGDTVVAGKRSARTHGCEPRLEARTGSGAPDLLILFAAVLGFVGVAMGAFGAHGLQGKLPVDLMAAFHTAVQYQLWHAVAALVVGVLWRSSPDTRLAGWCGAAMLSGIVLFSGSLFALSLTEQRWFGMITPLGGIFLLAGWLLLAIDRVLAIRGAG